MTFTALPEPRTPDPRDAPSLRWGILGPGWIAHRFVETLQARTTQRVNAVGSRGKQRAEAFAGQWSVPAAHGSYEALFDDPDVDIVYIATTHPSHRDNAIAALDAGKHVLVEKPLAVDAEGARAIAAAAARNDRFVGEAMWTKFLPKFDVIRQLLDAGALGEIRTVIADHGEFFTPDHRIYDASLAGGPLLDLGTYTIALAHFVSEGFSSVRAFGQDARAGLNGQISAVLSDATGNQALLHTTMLSDTPTTASIIGRDATLHLDGAFYMPGPFTMSRHRGHPDDPGRVLRYAEQPGGHTDGLHYAAVDAARCIAVGRRESEVHPLRHAISTLEVADEIRRQLAVQ
ncbi:Gfo/Idh/MocA family protein [Mycolicibacterium bacteremicum]|uniref:Oxidoreductase n=1 Tax=Mycolicibacterium bacteremicum TaxID=564198 RepID=A0A1W9YN35_MYCBA|nr:Gfo/Idh/MocA family oxidoreductase [Mycolicibacterium bacteremicum]MCV7431493.1 Gfo/Idh/MocA family oxidoreductase [Mycolicibacterium bacteremicum]ORA01443.1 oxidoreductase [Mycolicibacterium bacteremicum]